jgi:hypothetical protein
MRIATMVLGIILGAFFLLQTVLLASLGGAFDIQDAESFGQHGLLVVFLWLLGSSLVFGVPMLSVWAFALASVVCFIGRKGDLIVWGIASIGLAGLAYLSVREKEEADEDRAILRAVAKAFLASNARQAVAPSEAVSQSAPTSRPLQNQPGENSLGERIPHDQTEEQEDLARRLRGWIEEAWQTDKRR